MFHLRVILLLQLYIRYTRKSIQSIAWTPELITPFDSLRIVLTSSPVLARYNSYLSTFLKIDWSATGMGLILVPPAIEKVSVEALRALREIGEKSSIVVWKDYVYNLYYLDQGNVQKQSHTIIAL